MVTCLYVVGSYYDGVFGGESFLMPEKTERGSASMGQGKMQPRSTGLQGPSSSI